MSKSKINTNELASIADELDSAGMTTEADVLDKILTRSAQLLRLKEKPFLSRLAEIMLVLMKQAPGALIKGSNLTFPGSQKRLVGLTREEAVQEVRQHLEAFISQYLLPIFEQKYVNTQYEEEYRQFIDEVRGLAILIEHFFTGKTGRERIQQGLSAIGQTRKMLNTLLVNQRIRRRTDPDYPDASRELEAGLDILTELQVAVQRLNQTAASKYTKQLRKVFPDDLEEYSPLYELLYKLYPEHIPFIQQGVVKQEVVERLDEEHIRELAKVEESIKENRKEFDYVNETWADLDESHKRWQQVKQSAEAVQQESEGRVTKKFKNEKELRRRRKTLPVERFEEPKMYEYIHPTRRLEAINRDIHAVQEWMDSYSTHDARTWLTFSQFLSRGMDRNRLKKITKKIEANLTGLEQTLSSQSKSLEAKLNDAIKKRVFLKPVYDDTKNRVIWELWHYEFIDKLIEMVNVTLTPEISEEGTSGKAFKRVLREFRDLLDYEL